MDDFSVLDPRTGELLRSYAAATDADVSDAIRAACDAYAGWSDLPLRERADRIRRVAELHTARAPEIGALMEAEMGKSARAGAKEVEFSASIYSYYADNAAALLADRPVHLFAGTGSALIRPTSVGPLIGIMPWNYPTYQVARFAAPNLILGNTVILKHAPQCPESAAAIQQIFDDAEVPDGVFNNIRATVTQVEMIIADARIRGVSLTGSGRAGAAVAEIAGRHLKKIALELGGSDPFILLSTSDLSAVVQAAVKTRMENTGQSCNAAKRFIVAAPLYDSFLKEFTAKLLAAPGVSPLSSPGAATNLSEQISHAIEQGASFVTDGSPSGCFFPAGVLTDVSATMDVHHEELFGPVAIVYRADDEAHAIELANDTPYGLGSYVFTVDPDQAQRVADRIDAGMVFINGVGVDAPELPFGGTKRSGYGRELGSLGIEEFANLKVIRTVS